MPVRGARRLGIVIAVAMALLLTLAPAHASSAREEPVDEGWKPALIRQRADAPIQSAGFTTGRLRIPAIDIDETVRGGVALSVLDQGPAHWIGTALPGAQGNMVVGGHRTTHGAPFRNLHDLESGDVVFVANSTGFEVMYRVTETFVVSPEAIWITWDNGEALLTMFACHPIGSAAQRIVVRAELIADGRIA